MFVNQLASSTKDTAVLQAILDLGKRLGLHVCSEGIETPEQAQYLITNGCDEMQGYYFAKPVNILELPSAIERAKNAFNNIKNTPSIKN